MQTSDDYEILTFQHLVIWNFKFLWQILKLLEN